jgi:hypothetical protein
MELIILNEVSETKYDVKASHPIIDLHFLTCYLDWSSEQQDI